MTSVCRKLVVGLCALAASIGASAQSTCYGTPGHGRLEGGVSLPITGPNFAAYGLVPTLAGRTHMHHKARDTLLAAYAALEKSAPDVHFVYAESGWASGGSFKPHKTHQNGLSVDLMVPVRNADDASVPMPSSAFNRYGYDMQFDRSGHAGALRIDFDALGALILAIDDAAKAQGIALRRVLFAPDLQALLYRSRHGKAVRRRIQIPNKRSWVRHDEHIHVDFAIPCKPQTP